VTLTAALPQDFVWLRERAGYLGTPNATAMKVVDGEGRIRAMVAYDDFTPGSCQVHQACDSPIAWRRLIPAVFCFPFEQLKLRVVLGIVPGDNARALRQTKALGFKETYRVADAWKPGVPMVVHELRREDVVAKGWLPPATEEAHG
jgi:hypothetical protein